MEILTQRFVTKTVLFQNCSELEQLFDEDDHSFTWGSNSRSMIAPNRILLWAEKILGEQELWSEEFDPETMRLQVDTLRSRVWSLTDVLVDLES